jgi:hypothetical protein
MNGRGPIPPRKLQELGRIVQDHTDRANRRKRPEAGLAVPAILPRGPLPLEGGAEAPLD